MNVIPTVNKDQIISSVNQFIASDESVLNLTLIVSIFATIVTPYLPDTLIKFFHHDYFRIIVLAVIVYLYLQKSTIVTIILLILYLSTQMASVQKEHYEMIQNTKLENFSPSQEHMDETFHINPEYFRKSADEPLEGSVSDVPTYAKEDYLLYNHPDNMLQQSVMSEQPHFGLDDVTGFTGEENATF